MAQRAHQAAFKRRCDPTELTDTDWEQIKLLLPEPFGRGRSLSGRGDTIMRVPFFNLAPMHEELREDLDRIWAQVSRPESFVGGKTVEQFEAQWAEYCSASH